MAKTKIMNDILTKRRTAEKCRGNHFDIYTTCVLSVKMGRRFHEWYYFKVHATSQDFEKDEETKLDKITWLQIINSALKRSHGVFGEAIEYDVLHNDGLDSIIKVNYIDRQVFSTAMTSYISSDELVGVPLVFMIEQQQGKLSDITVPDEDLLWFKKLVEFEEKEIVD